MPCISDQINRNSELYNPRTKQNKEYKNALLYNYSKKPAQFIWSKIPIPSRLITIFVSCFSTKYLIIYIKEFSPDLIDNTNYKNIVAFNNSPKY